MVLIVAAIAASAIPVARAVRAYRAESKSFTSRRWTVKAPSDSAAIGLHDIGFRSRDGNKISGWYILSRNGAAIVLCHGSQADRSSMLDEARGLATAGFGILMFDWPGQGESEGRVEFGAAERSALLGALDFLATRNDLSRGQIGALGFSAGGYTLAQVAADDERIRAIVLTGAFGDAEAQTRAEYADAGTFAPWAAQLADSRAGFDPSFLRPQDIVAHISPRPLVIIAGSADRTTPPALGKALFNAAGEPKEFWLIQGAKHAGYAAADPSYLGRLVAFFTAALLPRN